MSWPTVEHRSVVDRLHTAHCTAQDEVTKQIKERERKRRLADNRRGRHR